MNNLVQIFFDAADRYADHIAIIHKKDKITYGDLRANVIKTAHFYENKGIRKGSKVLVFVPMSIHLYQTVLALFSIGAVVVFVDEWADRKRLQNALAIVEVDTVIAPKKYLWLGYLFRMLNGISIRVATPTLRQLKKLGSRSIFSDLSGSPFTEVNPDETALITFTTGSTGIPKAANRTHRFLRSQFEVLEKEIDAQPAERCLVTLPIVLLSILGTGATGVIADFNQKKPEQLNVEKQIGLINGLGVSMLIASPFFVERISESKTEVKVIRKILTGGAPVFPEQAQKMMDKFKDASCLVAYGSTEAEPISLISMQEIRVTEDGLSVGIVHPSIALKVIRITEEEVQLGKEGWAEWEADFGEIVVSGPHVLTNYYNSEEAFRMNKIVDGSKIWHRTGDSGRLVGGELFLNGRCSQLVRKGNRYLSLFLLEYQLSLIPYVQIGTIMDENVIVELEIRKLSPTHMKTSIERELKEAGIDYKELIILPHLPRDARHHSKIDYGLLRQEINNL